MNDNVERVKCDLCKKEIPKSVVLSVEGADYVHNFCCPDCRDHYFAKHPEKKLN